MLNGAVILNVNAGAGGLVKGMGAEFGTTDDTMIAAGAADPLWVGVPLHDAAAGAPCDVALSHVVPVLVGTNGATRGERATMEADGYTDAAAASGGATEVYVYGIFLQTGVAGDYVGMLIDRGDRAAG
jgi:hypothetical protein